MTAQLLPVPPPPGWPGTGGPGRVVVRLGLRSASPEVANALEADLHAFVAELSAGACPCCSALPMHMSMQWLILWFRRCMKL